MIEGEEEGSEEAGSESTEESGETTEETGVETIPSREDELNTQLETERRTNDRLQGQIDARNEQPPAPPVKEEPPPAVFTREQLRTAVDEGKLSEDQMEQMWADQIVSRTTRETTEMLDQRDSVRSVELTVDTEYEKYVAAFPDLKDMKSELWGKVKSAYDYNVKLGAPDTKATEVAAMRAALGSHERIQENTAALSETPQGTGGGAQGGKRPSDIWARVPLRLRAGLKEMVSKGTRTLADIEKDIPYMTERPQ